MKPTWSSWTGRVKSRASVLLFRRPGHCHALPGNALLKEACKTLWKTLPTSRFSTFMRNLKVVRTDRKISSFVKCLYIPFNDKAHYRDSCCQSVATFHRHPAPASALSASACRTLSPLEPDVPKIQSFWLSLRWDFTSQDKWKHKGGRRRRAKRTAAQREKKLQRLCIFASQFSLIADFPFKSCVRFLILLLSSHLFQNQGVTWSWARPRKWRGTSAFVWAVEPHDKQWEY